MVETRVSYGVRNESVDVHQELGQNDVSTGTLFLPLCCEFEGHMQKRSNGRVRRGIYWDLFGLISVGKEQIVYKQAASKVDSAGGPWGQKPIFDLTLSLTTSPNRRPKVNNRVLSCYQMLCCIFFFCDVCFHLPVLSGSVRPDLY